MKKIILYLYPNLNITIIKNKKNIYLYLYNSTYFFIINNINFIFNIKKTLNILELKSIIPLTNSTKLTNILNNFLFNWTTFFFNKIIFSGRGFKIKKKKNYIFLFFNKSHVSLYIYNNIIIKKLTRNKLLFFHKNQNIHTNDINKILNIRFVNIYTKRGLRLSRQIILKRKGKGGTQPQT